MIVIRSEGICFFPSIVTEKTNQNVHIIQLITLFILNFIFCDCKKVLKLKTHKGNYWGVSSQIKVISMKQQHTETVHVLILKLLTGFAGKSIVYLV